MAGEDRAYSKWVKAQPCCKCRRAPPSTQHHVRRPSTGLAQRSHDHESIPLCGQCHLIDLANLSGQFRGWEKAQLREWQREEIARHRASYASTPGCF
jgi:hypothetical protein